jgi:hypothetical protein
MGRWVMDAQHELHKVWSVDHGQRAQRHHSDHDDYGNGFLVHFIYLPVTSRFTSMRVLRERSIGQPGMQAPGWPAPPQR